MILESTYDPVLVIFSILIAIFASYTALHILLRLKSDEIAKISHGGIFNSAIALGIGIWSMHFIGMLAFKLPIPVYYDASLTIASLLAAIIACYVGIYLASGNGLARAIGSGTIVGLGIPIMHYSGMSAMQLNATAEYSVPLLTCSVLVSILVAGIAFVAPSLKHHITWMYKPRLALASSIILGSAIASMHYLGMAAVSFYPSDRTLPAEYAGYLLDPNLIGSAIGIATFILIAMQLLSSHREHILSVKLSCETEQLRASEQHFRTLIEDITEGVITADENGKIALFNKAAEQLFGYAKQDIIGKSINQLMPEKFARQHDTMMSNYSRSRESKFIGKGLREIEILRKDNVQLPVEVSVSEIRIGNRSHFTAVLRNIGERKIIEERFKYLASHDPLTNLANRNLLQDRLTQAGLRADRNNTMVAVVFLDLDNFKPINDVHGHHTGDSTLIEVSRRISEHVRKIDTVARIGGDEFCIILEGIHHSEDINAIVEKIRRAIAEPIASNDAIFNITASIGIACYPIPCSDIHETIKQADRAMYLAKQAGKNSYYFAEQSSHKSDCG